jgi:ATP-dependent protease HslVU (ClpYQ) peptidase subunit
VTTIAWDGKVLAADAQTSIFKGSTPKIHRLKDGSVFGSCGQMQDMQAVIVWLNEGGDKPKVSDGFHAIHVKEGRLFVLEDKLIPVQYEREFFAVGSGRDYAMAAMHLGKSAPAAVAIAAIFDVDTGGEVLVIEALPLICAAERAASAFYLDKLHIRGC